MATLMGRRSLAAFASAAALSLTAGCIQNSTDEESGPINEGPLTAVSIEGQQVPDADPGEKAGLVTFGGTSMCSTQPGADIELVAVRYNFARDPVKIVPWIRTVPVVTQRGGTSAVDWRPLISTVGYPPENLEDGAWRGAYTKDIENFTVNQSCFGASNLDSRRLELLSSMVVGPGGADLDAIEIDYRVANEDFTLTLELDHRVCGTAVC